MGTGQLHRGGSVTLDGNGNGTLIFAPDNANQSWNVTAVYIQSNQDPSASVVPQVQAYVNTPSSAGNSRGASWAGNQTSFSGRITAGPCDVLYVVFTAGPPGTICSAVLDGTYETRGAT